MLISGAICDKCGVARYAHGIHTKKEIIKTLRKAGWTIGKRTICSKCKPVPKKHEIL
jgi:hypothetical protein